MAEMQQNNFRKRLVAYKVGISDILKGVFVKDDLSAGHIKFGDEVISRVNIIATLVYKSEGLRYASAVVDDGTGRIALRTFENEGIFSNVNVGDVALIIGKVREFNGERYIMSEILKKIDNARWLNVRRTELGKIPLKNKEDRMNVGKDKIEEFSNVNEKLYLLIKKLDKGDGASVEEILKGSDGGAEDIINRLLEKGDIFEVKPGKLKVLE